MGLQRFTAASLAGRVFSADPLARQALLRALWPAVVGQDVARRTEVIGLEGEVLRIRVADVRWRKELFRIQRQILARLHRFSGGLGPARLGFIEGPVPQPPHASEAPSTLDPPLPGWLSAAAAAIPDRELRNGFVASAARYVARNRS